MRGLSNNKKQPNTCLHHGIPFILSVADVLIS